MNLDSSMAKAKVVFSFQVTCHSVTLKRDVRGAATALYSLMNVTV